MVLSQELCQPVPHLYLVAFQVAVLFSVATLYCGVCTLLFLLRLRLGRKPVFPARDVRGWTICIGLSAALAAGLGVWAIHLIAQYSTLPLVNAAAVVPFLKAAAGMVLLAGATLALYRWTWRRVRQAHGV